MTRGTITVPAPIHRGVTFVCTVCGADYSHRGGAAIHSGATHADPSAPWTFRTVYRVRHCGACDATVYLRRRNARTAYSTPAAAAGIAR